MQATLFISHGSPMLATEPGPYGAAWKAIADTLPRPDAILVVSAHWTTAAPALSLAEQPSTLHDFGGFPPELYTLEYPAPGAPEPARRVAGLLEAGGLPVAFAPERGLDHGAWVPLRHMYPAADVPVTQLSVQPGRDAAWHQQLGGLLRPLREENVLLLASGSLTHNLMDFDFAEYATDRALPYVRNFQDWMLARLAEGNRAALAGWQRLAPAAARAHPTPEHLLPLFVAVGAAGDGARMERPFARFSGGALAMDCYVFS